jgi:hypothetical protein
MPITLEFVEPDENGRDDFAIRACMCAALPGLDIIRIFVKVLLESLEGRETSEEFRSFRVLRSLLATRDSVAQMCRG